MKRLTKSQRKLIEQYSKSLLTKAKHMVGVALKLGIPEFINPETMSIGPNQNYEWLAFCKEAGCIAQQMYAESKGYTNFKEDIMRRKSLASQIVKREGKKVSVSIGNIREVEKAQFDLVVEQHLTALKDGYSLEYDHFTTLSEAAKEKATKIFRKK